MSVQFKRVIIKANIAISGLLVLVKRYEIKKRKYVGVLISAFIGVLAIVGVYWNYKMVPSNENQVKIGATYMTMNNDFYKVLTMKLKKSLRKIMIFCTPETLLWTLINKRNRLNRLLRRVLISLSSILLMRKQSKINKSFEESEKSWDKNCCCR